MFKKYIGLHTKYPLFLSDFDKLEFSRQNFEKAQIPNFMKIRPVAADLFHTDRRTDKWTGRHNAANSSFSQLCDQA